MLGLPETSKELFWNIDEKKLKKKYFSVHETCMFPPILFMIFSLMENMVLNNFYTHFFLELITKQIMTKAFVHNSMSVSLI